MLYPEVGSFGDGGVFPQYMQGFGPEPLGGINATFVFQVIFTCGISSSSNFLCLFHGGVIFPEHKHRIGVFGKFGFKREGNAFAIHRDGGWARGIETYTNNLRSRTGWRFVP